MDAMDCPSYSGCSFSAETRDQIYVLFPIAATGPEEVLLDCRHAQHRHGALTEGSFADAIYIISRREERLRVELSLFGSQISMGPARHGLFSVSTIPRDRRDGK
jgi:hypothetical protein